MTGHRTPTVDQQIAHILERFHETHRRELPAIVALARALEAQGAPAGLSERLASMGKALEAHMFKEKMRLFPMMAQGGNSLIQHLIADMEAEHVAHRVTMSEVGALLARLPALPGAEAELVGLRAAVAKLFDDLAQHIHAEDEVLFPLFARPDAARPLA